MIESRVCRSPRGPATCTPRSSGPRWARASPMRRSVPSSGLPRLRRTPAIPHMESASDTAEYHAVAGQPRNLKSRSGFASVASKWVDEHSSPLAAPLPHVSSRSRVLGRLLRSLKPHWQAVTASAVLALVVSGAGGLIAWLVKPAMGGIFLRRGLLMLKVIPLALLG